jgi:hypothetical protein
MTTEHIAGDHGKLINGWIKHAEHGVRSGGQVSDETFWAHEMMSKMCQLDPEAAWEVIQRIVERVDDEAILAFVGSGPLEDLLAQHGSEFVDRVISKIESDKKFAEVASSVWQNVIAADVWMRLQNALGQTPPGPGL